MGLTDITQGQIDYILVIYMIKIGRFISKRLSCFAEQSKLNT
jgi:hypothetical protein